MAWAPDYVTVGELGDYLVSGGIGDTQDDAQLALAVTAASRSIDHHTNRQFGVVAAVEERLYVARPGSSSGTRAVDVDDFMTATGLVVEIDGTAVTTFTQEPRNAAQKGRPWTRLVFDSDSEVLPDSGDEVTVTALWGWTAVPDTVKQATLLQASRMFTRRNAPFGVAGSPDAGSEMRLLAKVDPDVVVALRGYGRTRKVG